MRYGILAMALVLVGFGWFVMVSSQPELKRRTDGATDRNLSSLVTGERTVRYDGSLTERQAFRSERASLIRRVLAVVILLAPLALSIVAGSLEHRIMRRSNLRWGATILVSLGTFAIAAMAAALIAGHLLTPV